ncbi:hypothetical protein XENOCAPTIV_026803 [Xenoophorus captivus]|uniref:Uncharacterized protein n=1 Tax=Xenoophorus captivus TaxID=1517983 RepID=A0ABV0S0W1_9TELE
MAVKVIVGMEKITAILAGLKTTAAMMAGQQRMKVMVDPWTQRQELKLRHPADLQGKQELKLWHCVCVPKLPCDLSEFEKNCIQKRIFLVLMTGSFCHIVLCICRTNVQINALKQHSELKNFCLLKTIIITNKNNLHG